MKKITIVSNPRNEAVILEHLGQLGIIQLIECDDPEFMELQRVEKTIDYERLSQFLHSHYCKFRDHLPYEIKPVKPSITALQRFSSDPNIEVMSYIEQLQAILIQINLPKENTVDEQPIQQKMSTLSAEAQEVIERNEKRISTLRAQINFYTYLEPSERARCSAIGEVNNDVLTKITEYLKTYPDISFKTKTISPQKTQLFVFTTRSNWIEALFLVFDVTNTSDILTQVDKELPFDAERLHRTMDQYLTQIRELEDSSQQIRENLIRNQIKLKETNEDQIPAVFTEQQQQVLSEVAYLDAFLHILSSDNIPRLRTDVLLILQGWIHDEHISSLMDEVHKLETEIDDHLFMKFEDPQPDDVNIPTPSTTIIPSLLQPAWTLTRLRGWPSAFEFNPHHLNIIIFSFQFALMFGDVGQGVILLLLGFGFTKKFKRGIMSKLGAMFIPMGLSTIIMGFLYGEIFLIENLIPPLLFRPLENIGMMMKLTLGIAVFEMSLGLSISILNHIRQGNLIEAFGERGLGAILFLVGLFFSGLHFLESGNIFETFSYWSFMVMVGGLLLATITPILEAVVHKSLGMETLSASIGALLMTFVESLSNFFSFLRIAAFVLAHASLALAAHSLSGILGPGGLLITNLIAMTFELISTGVQSLRLLYYEFMGKFFQGKGSAFNPFVFTDPRQVSN
jgi:vacuolar-type H+-ATPase subunit I/STV1